ncbi:hypothetical protein HZC07_02765 [Candidatus Micrarchaeota archaeon]|nr:hypothetical protein [Candidatus Micrarchaeota archaeon]
MTRRKNDLEESESNPDRNKTKIIIGVLVIVLGAVLVFALGSGVKNEKPNLNITALEQTKGCVEGQIKNCIVGSCSGQTSCIGGSWSVCSLKQACTPGSTVPCLKQGCSYAFKKCNVCGTDYEQCVTP